MRLTKKARWLNERLKGLGGTDVAAICGLSPYRSAMDVYNDKLGLTPPVEENPAMQRGTMLEPIIKKLYAARTGRKVSTAPSLIHPTMPFLRGSPDFLIRPKLLGDTQTGDGLGEVKTHEASVFDRVRAEGVFPAHIVQLQWYMGVGRFRWGSFAIFCADRWDLLTFDVEFDHLLFGSLQEQAVRFWLDHVEPKVPPKLVSAPTVEVAPVGDAKVIDDEYLVEAMRLYREAKQVADEADLSVKLCVENLKLRVTEHGAYRLPSGTIRFTMEPGKKTLDRAALVAHGVKVEEFERTGAPYEKFTVYLRKET